VGRAALGRSGAAWKLALGLVTVRLLPGRTTNKFCYVFGADSRRTIGRHAVIPTASEVLRALAALSPAASEQRSIGWNVPLDWFRWLPVSTVRLFAPGPVLRQDSAGIHYERLDPGIPLKTLGNVPSNQIAFIDHTFGERLAAVQQIRLGSHALRLGWLFVAGRSQGDGGRPQQVFHPLISVAVRVMRGQQSSCLMAVGDPELTPLIAGRDARRELESRLETGGGVLDSIEGVALPPTLLADLEPLRRFALTAATAAGLPSDLLLPVSAGPQVLMRSEPLQIVAGIAVYATSDVSASIRATSLGAWVGREIDQARTAFHALYLPTWSPPQVDPLGVPVESAYLLTPTQRAAVIRSRTDPVTVISGAPGTGKSHTIVAIACDALAHGASVVVAAKSDDAVDALVDLLDRAPGPDPVVFGSNERRDALATRLAAGQSPPLDAVAVAAYRRLSDDAANGRDRLRWSIWQRLAAEMATPTVTMRSDAARLRAPRLFDPATNFEQIAGLITSATANGEGWLGRRHQRQCRQQLDELAGTSPAVALAEIIDLVDVARTTLVGDDLIRQGGLDLSTDWEELLAADDAARVATGKWLTTETRSADRINRVTLSAVAALATALRSGRAARRAQLATINRGLIRALPLWIGSLPDIDDLLPPLPGLFDLVILDEASSIDQPLAAAALLRATRAVIVGDPHQLRHVSFLSDQQIRVAISEAGLEASSDLASRLDVRRNSMFDVAAGVAPVIGLNEHFRSDPHLVDWVARKIYDTDLKLATRSPATESKDCIDIIRVDGHRDTRGVVQTEVDQVVAQLKRLRTLGADSVGVVTPFRAQADAIETAILSAFTADDLEAMDLRVGTVHAFQGNERDIILASLALGPEESANSWRFVEDPHLFDVLVTRARKSFVIILSADPPIGGLVADYLKQADSPPGRPPPVGPLDPWSQAVAEHLQTSGLRPATSYPTGRHIVDVCVHTPGGPVSIECTVHPHGPDAHIERHLALRRAGWRIVDAYKSKWGERRGELAVELVQLLTPSQ
jgi:hypothetical protein